MTTPAGWYPDPSGLPVQRYWDGQQWTSTTAPFAAPFTPNTGERVTINYGFALLAGISLLATLFFAIPLMMNGISGMGLAWLFWGGLWTAIWSAFAYQRSWRR